MPTLTQLAAAEQQRANAANEARYQQSLSLMTGARKRMSSLFDAARAQLASQGRQGGIDIDIGAARQQAQGTQNLMTAGLGNTTVRGAMSRGIETDRTAAQARLSEGIAGQRAGLLTQQAGAEMSGAQAMTGLIGSKQDVGPDMGRYASLVEKANAAPTRGRPPAWKARGAGGLRYTRGPAG